ncbi:hypothetical protein MCOR25_000337 [Pyricularia grisea]|nr:hypothetical protein MCOR25_000337 [Pyricularia grisea]
MNNASRLTNLLGIIGLGASNSNAAVCKSNLVIDNFSKFSTNTNNLGSYTSDDGTMSKISASGGALSFTPKTDSYFYESFSCRKTTAEGYNALSFMVQAPAAGSSMTIEIQTNPSCDAGTTYKSAYYGVTGISTTQKTFTVPLSSFVGTEAPKLDFVSTFAFSVFSSNKAGWKLSNIQLVCDASSVPSSSVAPTTATSTTGGNTAGASTASPTRASSAQSVASTTVAAATTTSSTTAAQPSSGTCNTQVIDDWQSQSRLTFLYYNAMLKPSSDEGSMNSIVVGTNNRVTLNPKDKSSYFYSQTGCSNVKGVYGGISLKIKASSGAKFAVQLASVKSCDSSDQGGSGYRSTTDLGWSFDGSEKLYHIDFAKFPEVDFTKLNTVLFAELPGAVTFGPMAFYCGSQVVEYSVPKYNYPAVPSATVAAPIGPTQASMVIDTFSNSNSNNQGGWHGGDDAMKLVWGTNKLTITSTDADYAFYSNLGTTCKDITSFDGGYLHVQYSGSTKFTIALQQHNSQCDETIAPFPETWDSLEAARYASNGHIYIPMSHFNIERKRALAVAFKGFYSSDPVTLSKIEIVNKVPDNFKIPNKLATGNLVFACKRPNSFAFAIDDGAPNLAPQVMDIIRDEGIKVTFFTVGAPLEDPGTNLSTIYRDMVSQGHQLALHSYTHPKMEGLPSNDAIDWEYAEDIQAVKDQFNGYTTKYFRPPFGNEGARMRQRLVANTGSDSAYIVNWSVDVEDWLWAESSTPEKQLDAFKRDVAKGGNLVVLHYLYPSTVGYLRQFIQLAKATGKNLMRVDQCMEDPNAPAF